MINLRGLSRDTAISLLEQLVKSSDPNELLLLLAGNPSTELMRLTDIVHRLFCVQEHDPGNQQSIEVPWCGYEIEEQIEETWQNEFHKHWLLKTLSTLGELNVSNEDEFLKVYGRALAVVDKLRELQQKEPAAYQLARKLITLFKD